MRIDIHLEACDGEAVWWAEAEDFPGLSAAADTLDELKRLVREVIEMEGLAVEPAFLLASEVDNHPGEPGAATTVVRRVAAAV